MTLSSHLALALALGSLAVSAQAQRYEMADGTFLEAGAVRLRGGALVHVVEVDGGAGAVEQSYAIKDVVRLEWPEPAELIAARASLAQGDTDSAVAALATVRRQFAPFACVPGSWWTEASRLELRALSRDTAGDAVARVARELATRALDPEAVGEARLALTELEVRAGRVRLAEAMLEAVLAGQVSAEIRARAWLLRGDIALAGKRHEEAIEAYLRIPVFHSAYAELLPAAFAAAEKAFRAYGDETQADRMADELKRFDPGARSFPPPVQDNHSDLISQP